MSQPDVPAPSPAPALNIAPIWARLLALLVDGLIWLPLIIAVAAVATRSPGPAVTFLPLMLVAYLAYQVGFHARFGATPGKMVMKLRIVRAADGEPIDLNAALRRSFVDAVFRIGLAILSVKILRDQGTPESLLAFAKLLQQDARYLALGNMESVWTFSGLLTCIVTPRRRALHDFIAGTVVVKTGPR